MSRSTKAVPVMIGLLLVASYAAPAAAQEAEQTPPTRAEDEAREAFRRGSEAAQEERWADSEREFRRSYELSGATSALFNQAVALRALGRLVEARDAFDRLLEDPDALDPRIREQSERLREETEARIATLVLTGLGEPSDALHVTLDGDERRDDGARPLELEVDEGHHALSVEQRGFEPFRWSGDFGPGARQTVDVALVPLPEATREVVVVERPASPGVNVLEEAWFWVVIGVVVLGATAGIVTGLMLDAQLEGESGLVIEL